MSDDKKSIYERYNVYNPFQECRHKKHPCTDCGFCQWCSDSRCSECLARKKASGSRVAEVSPATEEPKEICVRCGRKPTPSAATTVEAEHPVETPADKTRPNPPKPNQTD